MSEDLGTKREEAYKIISSFIEKNGLTDKVNIPAKGFGASELIEGIKLFNPRSNLGLQPSELSFFAKRDSQEETLDSLISKAEAIKTILHNKFVIEGQVKHNEESYNAPIAAVTIDINQEKFDEKLAAIAFSMEHGARANPEQQKGGKEVG